jgi:transposase-like protein
MEPKIKLPKTQMEAIQYFADPDNCHNFMVALRWPNGVTCPRCGSKEIGKLVVVEKNRKGEPLKFPRRIWNCKNPECHNKQFSAKVGTIFEDSPLGLDKCLTATWLIVNAKNGISSYELSRAIGVTQKTAWFLLHRIRLAMQDGSLGKLKGTVEADESYIGGKARYMHKHKRPKGTGMVGKTAVLGLLERNAPDKASRVRLKVMQRVRVGDLDPEVRANVEKGAEVITDNLSSYYKLADEYTHKIIDHAESYAQGHVHVNGLENFWSLLKRGIKGTYVSVEPFHLFRYLDEQAFRFNERKDNDAGRFAKAVATVATRRLTYKKLIGKAVA